MAFKKMKSVNDGKNMNKLVLDDGETVKGIFLYEDYDDVLLCDCHYIKSPEYNGYVHCLEAGCPVCKSDKNIALQHKLFIPFLVLSDLNEKYDENQVLFWDRGNWFDQQLRKDVFKNYPKPMEYIFSITRHGEYRSRDTRYVIDAVSQNKTDMKALLSNMGISFPEYYENICKEFDPITLTNMINSGNDDSSGIVNAPTFSYEVKPRVTKDPSDFVADIELPKEEVDIDAIVDSVIGDDNEPDF